MLKTLLFLFGRQIGMIVDGINNEVVGSKNKSTVLLSKK